MRRSRRRWLRLACVMLALSGGCRGDSPPLEPKTGPLMPGDYQRKLAHGGRSRSYLLHVPPAGRASRPLPLVIAFHGGGGHAENQKECSKLDAVADREGFVTVYPDGTGPLSARLL